MKESKHKGIVLLCLLCLSAALVESLPDQGIWDFSITQPDEYVGVSKSLYKGSDIIIKVTCGSDHTNISVGWMIRQTPCWNEYLALENQAGRNSNLSYIYDNPQYLPSAVPQPYYNSTWFYVYPERPFACDAVVLPEVKINPDDGTVSIPATSTDSDTGDAPSTKAKSGDGEQSSAAAGDGDQSAAGTSGGNQKSAAASAGDQSAKPAGDSGGDGNKQKPTKKAARVQRAAASGGSPAHRQMQAPADGIFLLVVHVTSLEPRLPPTPLNVTVHIEMKADYGYLSAADWPNLPFYSVMCAVYVLYGLGWLVVCARQWRELLRIQFWIGGVIAMGMLEKAVFLAEYESVNRTGHSVWGAVVFAELVSCAKRALARMLVIIVSLGFGITKPRLGPLLHRIMAVGLLFFMFASIESCTRALRPKNDLSGGTLGTSVVLALLDSGICWWVFSALLNTTRTLRLRRNEVKLTLYRHFTNTLILAVLASVGFMVWMVRFHRTAGCLRQWKNLWADEACWHVLFSIILLVIMLLWRPTNNNQRYAFTPLLDAGDEDEEDELFRSDAYHDLKMRSRGQSSPGDSHNRRSRNNSDDDLKWVEDNIPASMEPALPAMDSDEEVMQAKFEISKMQ
ncbi:transmembrane protein 87A-like [Amphibalanus amphitrite]|uniref:transmembrane protein 87A-like n=1 Tax=Amphibalanus amphitrite TaxID=1232801 RepID=UPI001C91C00D|nr:transmembrane protein 87A-like [Amphibalanus amphitrite]XP_043236219.1 transmembrane protein 87A-like [Amphibalanus amphitrite]XP_043236220.1 transmembrane protein 87A-like [Amphibalanus amphitrite]XP_043236221.1 transmembrane protein 87A-like [Amphibalanus amphitrite]XP_043236222.1 transmembrane protein 87A-like [Amphibalanus amphitrite]XP_043236223.1 transmembrane protein 87A-like [Amphibalanus amphitrite]XP_043236224.1 transmembrane protein 87A-like [Amphibalanus amphitrite]